MNARIFRIQDADGRGPYKPGFSAVWCDNYGPPPPPTWMHEFPGLLRRMNEDAHYGSACRSVEQIGKWFTPSELLRLHLLGYRLVAMHADRILAESKNQLVFLRRKPLNEDIEFIDIDPRISSGSAPQNRMPEAGGQRTTRAATNAQDGRRFFLQGPFVSDLNRYICLSPDENGN